MFKIIPDKAINDNTLNGTDIKLLAIISTWSKNGKACYEKNSTLAETLSCSKQNISNSISKLIKKNYINSKLFYKKDSKEVDYRLLILSKDVLYSMDQADVEFKKAIRKRKENRNTPNWVDDVMSDL